jgi:site-specific DNA-methyltransferase (adenine-specific)
MSELIWTGKNYPTPVSHMYNFHNCEVVSGEEIPPSHDYWFNRLIRGDKRNVLPALLPEFTARINLIYIDPPFMTGRHFTHYSDTWNNNLDAYLQWLYETFSLLHLLLADTGSLYVHLDWRASHYARVILDEVFGCAASAQGPGFKNEIIWHYQSGGRPTRFYARKHDTLFLYTRSDRYCFHGERIGEKRGTNRRNHMRKEIDESGCVHWTIRSSGRLYTYDQNQVMTPTDVWSDISHLQQKDPERNGYSTQKPSALLERIILASSEENDLVLDCFCGSGVTPIVAEQLGRRWIASDQNPEAISMTRERLLAREQVRPFVVQQVKEEI